MGEVLTEYHDSLMAVDTAACDNFVAGGKYSDLIFGLEEDYFEKQYNIRHGFRGFPAIEGLLNLPCLPPHERRDGTKKEKS
ncbi:hypothetical protein SUGI_0899640 [Cryptomeria japonica]|nr:hypothetical protein SUGI_0899640 [Cryptomeria japonica]